MLIAEINTSCPNYLIKQVQRNTSNTSGQILFGILIPTIKKERKRENVFFTGLNIITTSVLYFFFKKENGRLPTCFIMDYFQV